MQLLSDLQSHQVQFKMHSAHCTTVHINALHSTAFLQAYKKNNSRDYNSGMCYTGFNSLYCILLNFIPD